MLVVFVPLISVFVIIIRATVIILIVISRTAGRIPIRIGVTGCTQYLSVSEQEESGMWSFVSVFGEDRLEDFADVRGDEEHPAGGDGFEPL
jgi:hypothetical protein